MRPGHREIEVFNKVEVCQNLVYNGSLSSSHAIVSNARARSTPPPLCPWRQDNLNRVGARHVNAYALDVEGAELSPLRGGRRAVAAPVSCFFFSLLADTAIPFLYCERRLKTATTATRPSVAFECLVCHAAAKRAP